MVQEMSTFNKYRLKGAFHYDWYETEDWYRYLIDRSVKFCKGSTVDIGCGEGLLIKKINSKGYATIGVDKDPDAISLAFRGNQNSFMSWRNISAEAYANMGIYMEYLACINTVEHLNNPEVIKDIIRNQISKGAIITTIDYQGGSLGEDHKFEWTYDQMMDFFKEFKPKGFRYKDTEWIGLEITK